MFKSQYFIWKGKQSKDKFLSILTTDNDVLNDFGVPYNKTLEKEDNLDLYNEKEEEPEDITLQLYLEKDGVPLIWTSENFREIKKWLISDDFEEFISYDNLDYIYYLKCTKIQKKFTYGEPKGCIEVTFKPLSQYAYKKVIIEKEVKGKELINIHNSGDLNYEPIIVIESNCKRNQKVKVNDFVINNLLEEETIKIDNKMCLVKSDKRYYPISDCNRKWINLKQGDNQLIVEGECNIIIYCSFPEVI